MLTVGVLVDPVFAGAGELQAAVVMISATAAIPVAIFG